MRRALAPLFLLAALGGCGGSPPTAQEENLPERSTGPEVAPVDAANAAAANNVIPPDVGERAGISGATQGPTAGNSDAPYSGEDSRSRNP